jgi:hypothetical protein
MKEKIQMKNQQNIRQLILDCYEKAENESKLPSKSSVLNYLSEQLNMNVSDRTLQRYYNRFVENDGSKGIPNYEILNTLSNYLGFENFRNYCDNLQITKKKVPSNFNFKKLGIGASVIGTIGLGSYFLGTNEPGNCMKWKVDSYVKTPCENAASSIYPSLPMDENLMENFRKIKVNENTQFFEYGKPKIWYSKTSGKIEFFNSPGNHPATGKPLKPITQYMVDKYVLKTKKQ